MGVWSEADLAGLVVKSRVRKTKVYGTKFGLEWARAATRTPAKVVLAFFCIVSLMVIAKVTSVAGY
jgi:hypothetical protein